MRVHVSSPSFVYYFLVSLMAKTKVEQAQPSAKSGHIDPEQSSIPSATQLPAKKEKFKPAHLIGRVAVDQSSAREITLDKHAENLRYKVAYSAHKIADDLAIEVSKKTKKDKEYIKGLVWSLGVLFDKLAGATTDAVTVRIPSKLLENVKAVIAVQIDRRAAQTAIKQGAIDVTPAKQQDSESSTSPDKSTV